MDQLHRLDEEKSFDGLHEQGTAVGDPRVRISALWAMIRQFGSDARETLQSVIKNKREIDKVRRWAARLVGRTGPGSLEILIPLLEPTVDRAVREGAVLGLGEVGDKDAVDLLYRVSSDSPDLRDRAVTALARCSQAE